MARFAHITGTCGGCNWPAFGCVVEGGGADGLVCTWLVLLLLRKRALCGLVCVLGLIFLGHRWQGLHIFLAWEGVCHGLYSSDLVGRWKGLHIDGFLTA